MTKRTTAMEARKSFGQMLEEAYYRGDAFIIERAGKPMAALISIQDFERLQKQKQDDQSVIDDIRKKTGQYSQKEIERDVDAAIKQVRKNIKGRS